MVAAAFEHVQEALTYWLDIGVRVVERVADAGLRGEMDDAVGPLLGEGASTTSWSARSPLTNENRFAP